MAVHRLSCACGEAFPVADGRAGGEIDCPRCGARIPIPKLRRLKDLPPWEALADALADGGRAGLRRGGFSAAGGRWGTAEAVLAAGAAVASACLVVAGWLARPEPGSFDAAAIAGAIDRVPTAELYRAWLNYDRVGVARMPTTEEERIRRTTRSKAMLALGVGMLGGVAGLAAVGAAAAIVARRRLTEGVLTEGVRLEKGERLKAAGGTTAGKDGVP